MNYEELRARRADRLDAADEAERIRWLRIADAYAAADMRARAGALNLRDSDRRFLALVVAMGASERMIGIQRGWTEQVRRLERKGVVVVAGGELMLTAWGALVWSQQ